MSDEPVPADRKRMRPEDRRNAVLDAALRVFADAGFRRASLTEVGEEAGVTKGCVYHYFASKEELLLALMRERASSLGKECQAEASSASRDEALAMMVKSLWRKYEHDGQLELSTMALTELPHAPSVARVMFDEVATPNRAFLRDVLQRLNTMHTTRIEVDGTVSLVHPEDVADNVTVGGRIASDDELAAILVPYMIMGAALGHRMYRDIDPVKRTSDDIEAALLRILQRGL